ncbi:MAG: hypothetical protein JO108_20785 [Acidobacteriaceae bacterium]|nr:hypothetical protein [Acidobacteriaceae bacterium]
MSSKPYFDMAGAHLHFAGSEVGLLHLRTSLPYFNPTWAQRHRQVLLILQTHLRLNG